jgi:hypothetical protein
MNSEARVMPMPSTTGNEEKQRGRSLAKRKTKPLIPSFLGGKPAEIRLLRSSARKAP